MNFQLGRFTLLNIVSLFMVREMVVDFFPFFKIIRCALICSRRNRRTFRA